MDLNYFKEKWNYFVQTAVWILTVAGTFLVPPPLLNVHSASQLESFTRFIVAGLLALLFIPIRKFSRKSDYRRWYRIAVISFILCVTSTIAYYILSDQWSINYYGKVLVNGKTMFTEAAENKKQLAAKLQRPMVDDETFIKARGGETQYIWPLSELKQRFYILSAIYVFCVVSIGAFLIAVIQSIFCYEISPRRV
jgi:hypothetical protein